MIKKLNSFTLLALLTMTLALTGCGGGKDKEKDATKDKTPAAKDKGTASVEKVKVAFITNNASPFWIIAKAGVIAAEKEFNATCQVLFPPNGTADEQKQYLEDLMTRGVSGVAISPKDSVNQTADLNKAAARMNLICHDSDAPESKRLAYVGSNNISAGRAAGELIKEALPDGGKIMLFVGSIDAQNAQERKKGIEEVIKGTKIEIAGIRTDETDRKKAADNVEDTFTSAPDVVCLVGLWSYNGPAIVEATRKAGKLGKIKIVTFDEEDATLQAVKEGHVFGTVVQDPYMFGYESVRILAALARKEDPKIPANKIVEVSVKKIKPDNVEAFWKELKARLESAK